MNIRVLRLRLSLSSLITRIYNLNKVSFIKVSVLYYNRVSVGFCISLDRSKSNTKIRVNCYKRRGTASRGRDDLHEAVVLDI